jgi:hypothetical protein
MKTKKQNKKANEAREFYQTVERICSSKFTSYAVLCLMAYSFAKADTAFLGMMRQAYAQAGLIDTYVREEPVRTPLNLTSEIRLTTTSGS